MSQEYIDRLEKDNEELRETLSHYDLIQDILDSKVNVVRSDIYNKITPEALCAYLEKSGWVMKYEKEHERYLTRCYVSCRKDIKVRIHMKDLNPNGSRNSDISKKIRIAIETFSNVHNKGSLLVVFEILKENI